MNIHVYTCTTVKDTNMIRHYIGYKDAQPWELACTYVSVILIHLFSGGSDYVPIVGVNFEEATIFSVNVSALTDDLVELSESFFVTGQVLGVFAVPATFGSRLEVTIESPPGEFEGRFCAMCITNNNSFVWMHVYTVQYVYTCACTWNVVLLYSHFKLGFFFLPSLLCVLLLKNHRQ